MAVDIDKEEEALRSGVERAALVLNSRLEPAAAAAASISSRPLLKNDSMESNGTTSDDVTSASACTTQPLDAIIAVAEAACPEATTTASTNDEALLLDAISFASSGCKDVTPQVSIEAIVTMSESATDIAKC